MVNKNWNRREILKSVAASSAVLALPPGAAAFLPDAVSDREIQIAPVGPHTIRLTVLPIRNGVPVAVSMTDLSCRNRGVLPRQPCGKIH